MWHASTDDAFGTDVYGTNDANPLGSSSFSV